MLHGLLDGKRVFLCEGTSLDWQQLGVVTWWHLTDPIMRDTHQASHVPAACQEGACKIPCLAFLCSLG